MMGLEDRPSSSTTLGFIVESIQLYMGYTGFVVGYNVGPPIASFFSDKTRDGREIHHRSEVETD
jgi:hypothetical protein